MDNKGLPEPSVEAFIGLSWRRRPWWFATNVETVSGGTRKPGSPRYVVVVHTFEMTPPAEETEVEKAVWRYRMVTAITQGALDEKK